MLRVPLLFGKLRSPDLLRLLSLAGASAPLSGAAQLAVSSVAARLGANDRLAAIVDVACVPVCFLAWLWKGASITEAIIGSTPFYAPEPIRSTLVSGLFGAGLSGVLMIAAARILPNPEAYGISARLILDGTAWTFLRFALLGFWLSRCRKAAVRK